MPSLSNFNAECLDKLNTTTTIQQIGLLSSAQFYILVESCVHKHLLLYENSEGLFFLEKTGMEIKRDCDTVVGSTKGQ
jgi:hypothetical protein